MVTGASGHVGAALVRALLEQGNEVRAIVNSDRRAVEGLPVEVRALDITDREKVLDALRGADVVYHAAARLTLESVSDPVAEAINVAGTANIIDACRRHGVRRLVHFSTAHALGRTTSQLLEDGAGLPYERSKAAAERSVLAAAASDLDAVIVSPCAVLGPHDYKPSHIGRVLLMLARRRLPAVVTGGQSWVDVRDIARGAIAAARNGKRGDRYVLGGHWLTMSQFMKAASHAAGVSAPLFTVPPRVAIAFLPLAQLSSRWLKMEPLFTRASLEALESGPRASDALAETVLGHAPRPLAETLHDTFAWFAERGLYKAPRRN